MMKSRKSSRRRLGLDEEFAQALMDGIPFLEAETASVMLRRAGSPSTVENVDYLIALTRATAYSIHLAAYRQTSKPELEREHTLWLKRLASDPARALGETPPLPNAFLRNLKRVASSSDVDLETRQGAVWAGDYAKAWIQSRQRPRRGKPSDDLHRIVVEAFCMLAIAVDADTRLGEKDAANHYSNGDPDDHRALPPPGLALLMRFVEAVCDAAMSISDDSERSLIMALRSKRPRSHLEKVVEARARISRLLR
jgi:hypothetical protein